MNKVCDISIILVNYNGKRYIDILMDSLCQLDHDGFTYEVIFVDNASTDGSLEYLTANHYEDRMTLKMVRSETNLGFAGGNNLGVRNASGRYIVFLNNDTKPEQDWLKTLYHYIDDRPEVVMVNSKLLFFYNFLCLHFHTQDKIFIEKSLSVNGKNYDIESKFCKNVLFEQDQIVCFGNSEIFVPLLDGAGSPHAITLRTILAGDGDTADMVGRKRQLTSGETTELSASAAEVSAKQFTLIQNAGSGINKNYDGYDIGFCQQDCGKYSQAYEIDSGCGASIICRKADFEECGGFDEAFFMYYEDTDLSFRMRRRGGKIIYCPDSVVRHIHAGSSIEWSPFFTYYVCRNKLLFLKKNMGYGIFLSYFFRQLKAGLQERNRSKVRASLHALIGRTGWQCIEK